MKNDFIEVTVSSRPERRTLLPDTSVEMTL
jgi:hypothetical protein